LKRFRSNKKPETALPALCNAIYSISFPNSLMLSSTGLLKTQLSLHTKTAGSGPHRVELRM
jgi:hypothetical protein